MEAWRPGEKALVTLLWQTGRRSGGRQLRTRFHVYQSSRVASSPAHFTDKMVSCALATRTVVRDGGLAVKVAHYFGTADSGLRASTSVVC